MSIKSGYIIILTVLHLIIFFLALYIFREQIWTFALVEIVLIISLLYCLNYFQSFARPLTLISGAIDAIADGNYDLVFRKVGHSEMDKLISIYNQMIENLKEERLKNTQRHFFLSGLINKSPTGIIVVNYDESIAICNPAALKLLGIKEVEVEGKSFRELSTPWVDKLIDLPLDEPQALEIKGMKVFNCQKSFFWNQGFKNFFYLIEEITTQKFAIEKKVYSQVIKMMSHEVNNSIGPINSILESLRENLDEIDNNNIDKFSNALKIAIDRNHRLNQFTRKFSEVIQLSKPILEKIDLREVINDVVYLMSYQMKMAKIELDLDLPNQPIELSIDVKQIEQVLINVIKNSMEAIQEEGVIQIKLVKHPIKLQITDNGIGINEADSARLFSSFFSTKPNSQGIGLTLVREILTNHGFSFSLQSNQKGKTTFQILF